MIRRLPSPSLVSDAHSATHPAAVESESSVEESIASVVCSSLDLLAGSRALPSRPIGNLIGIIVRYVEAEQGGILLEAC